MNDLVVAEHQKHSAPYSHFEDRPTPLPYSLISASTPCSVAFQLDTQFYRCHTPTQKNQVLSAPSKLCASFTGSSNETTQNILRLYAKAASVGTENVDEC